MITPATPSAASAARAPTCAAEPTPPEAMTGMPAARATARVPSRAGPRPAADLDRDGDRRADRPHEVRLHGPADTRAVEIDDVQPPRAGRLEAAGDRDGIVAVHGLAIELPLHQPHTTPPAQIDGGIDG